MLKFLFFLAVAGWVLGLTAHLLSLAEIDVTAKVPFIWLLHIGIFVVWIPIILYLRKNNSLDGFQSAGRKRFDFLGLGLKNIPVWLAVIAGGGMLYAVINFLIFLSLHPGTAYIREGQYILENHGQFIRTLTEKEYVHYKASELRGFSGHWIAFYGVAMAILYTLEKRTSSKDNVKPV